MKRWLLPRRLRYAVPGLGLLVFAGLYVWGVQNLETQRTAVIDGLRTSSWIVSQAVLEHQRLLRAVERFAAGDPAVGVAAVRLRFEVFWSRIPLLDNGREAVMLRDLPGIPALPRDMIAMMHALEPRIARIADRNPADLAAIANGLSVYSEPLRQLLFAANRPAFAQGLFDTVERASRLVQWSLAAAIGFGALFILLLVAEMRRSGRLRYEMDVAAATAEAARRHLEDAVESMSQAFALYDPADRLTLSNHHYAGLITDGGPPPTPGDGFDAVVQRIATGLADGGTENDSWGERMLAQHGDAAGEPVLAHLRDGRVVQFTDYRMRDGGIVSLGADISELVAHERALRQGQSELHQAQKLRAVGQLTGGIAHEFNNLLHVVIGNLEAAQALAPEPGPLPRLLRAARRGAKRGADLTDRLLVYSRRQPLASRPVDLRGAVRDLRRMLASTLGDAYSLHSELAADLWQAQVDPGQLETALLNLCLNARDAMAGGGVITIAARNVQVDGAEPSAGQAARDGQYVLIEVRDDGIGMTDDVIAHAFDPFFTTKEVGKGTGLGLSMVQGFVQQSGGFPEIISTPGAGTTVRLYLPVAPAVATAMGEVPADSPA